MIIRKLMKFEGAHVVRNCTSRRCALSVHGHSYVLEFMFEGTPDRGQMVYDFGLLKGVLKEMVDSFDHAITLWDQDDSEYLRDQKRHSARWIVTPFNPSAEMFALYFVALSTRFLAAAKKLNGETVTVHSVICHETATGYAQAFPHDLSQYLGCASHQGQYEADYLKAVAEFINRVQFSSEVCDEWTGDHMRLLTSDEQFTPLGPLRQVATD